MKKQVISDALWVDVGDLTVMRDGRIFRNNWRGTGKIKEVKQTPTSDGYLHFRYNGIIVRSHRFIAKAFISNPENLPEINHRDEQHSTPNSNSPLNLEWCDRKYNVNYGTRTERMAKTNTNGVLSKKVYQYALDGSFIREWPSAAEVKRQLGYDTGHICDCCRGGRKSAHGFIWSYDPPDHQ